MEFESFLFRLKYFILSSCIIILFNNKRLNNLFQIFVSEINFREVYYLMNIIIIIIVGVGSNRQKLEENREEELLKKEENFSSDVTLFWRWKPDGIDI